MKHIAQTQWIAAVAIAAAGIFSLPVVAATIDAASCSAADVQSAISAASDGDTVAVPAGNCTWSGTITLNKGIHLRGAGSSSTRITVSGVINMSKHTTYNTSLSGFGFSKSGGGNAVRILVVGGGWTGAPPLIFDNTFTVNNSGAVRYETNGGIVFRNVFSGTWDESALVHKINNDQDSWATADTFGSRDSNGSRNLYVEDNTFNNMPNQATDFDDASRVVFRHNTLNQSSFNSHGMDTSPVGVRHFEIYDNDFRYSDASVNQNWHIWIRGGTGVIFNNKIANLVGQMWGDKPELHFSIRGAEDARPQGSCSSVSYPVPRQLGQSHNGSNYTTDPIYIWGNTGTQAISAGWNWGNPCGLNFSSFWQSGRDYVTGSAKPGYSPYAYPHPLRSSNIARPSEPLPEGHNGIAAGYASDDGIASDPRVTFADNFESYTSPSQLTSTGGYLNYYQASNIAFDTSIFFAGTKSLRLRMPSTGSEVSNAIVRRISPAQDIIFMRVYGRYQPSYSGVNSAHNGLRISGKYTGPGRRPNGTDFFLVNVENSRHEEGEPGFTHAYVYHPEQDDIYGERWFPDGSTRNGSQSFGSDFIARPNVNPARGVWISYEVMIKLNTPGSRDGRVAVWQDGALVADWTGLRFRDVNTLKIDEIQLENGGQRSTQQNDKWYDDLVVATSYIGPMSTGSVARPNPPVNVHAE